MVQIKGLDALGAMSQGTELALATEKMRGLQVKRKQAKDIAELTPKFMGGDKEAGKKIAAYDPDKYAKIQDAMLKQSKEQRDIAAEYSKIASNIAVNAKDEAEFEKGINHYELQGRLPKPVAQKLRGQFSNRNLIISDSRMIEDIVASADKTKEASRGRAHDLYKSDLEGTQKQEAATLKHNRNKELEKYKNELKNSSKWEEPGENFIKIAEGIIDNTFYTGNWFKDSDLKHVPMSSGILGGMIKANISKDMGFEEASREALKQFMSDYNLKEKPKDTKDSNVFTHKGQTLELIEETEQGRKVRDPETGKTGFIPFKEGYRY